MLMQGTLVRMLVGVVAAALFGCAAAGPKEVKLVWPNPPEEPRIVFLKSYRSVQDIKKKSILDSIFGEQFRAFEKPYAVAASGDKIYLTLTGAPSVVVMDVSARDAKIIGVSGSGALSLPIDVAVSADGIVFVSDAKQMKIFGYDPEGKLKIAIGKKDEFKRPTGIALNDELKRLYIVDSKENVIKVYSTAGVPLFQFGRGGQADGEFHSPTNIAIDRRNGNVAVVDTLNFRVQVFTSEGKFIRKFGEIGDRIGTFSRPKGIGIDSEGNVYVTDAAFDNFQIFNDKGELLLYIGSAGSEAGKFMLPAGLFVDSNDRIYVVDQLGGRVQIFQFLSSQWKKDHPDEYKQYLLPAGFSK